jgi:hypothetical protein
MTQDTARVAAESPAFKMYAHIEKPGRELELNILHRKHDIQQLKMHLKRGNHRDSPNT